MLISENKISIDLSSLPSNIEFPFNSLILKSEIDKVKEIETGLVNTNFKFEELNINDASSSLKFFQYDSSLILTIYGPREAKFRDKQKNEGCFIEIYTKFNQETSKESKFIFFNF